MKTEDGDVEKEASESGSGEEDIELS